jgi:hypothetical protein
MLVIEWIKQWSKKWVPGKNCKIDHNSSTAISLRDSHWNVINISKSTL